MSIHIPETSSYEDAVQVLRTSLLTTAGELTGAQKRQTLKRYIQRSGLSLEEVERLPVIHIAGTKGKGSTCAYCESICRAKGYKTGMFISPHVVEARERIRLNGKTLSKKKFAKYFWSVYRKLKVSQVGMGGEHDYTNFFPRPVACGITSLGYDHCPVLGYYMGHIAWHKAGIMKKNCPAITVEQVTPDPKTQPKKPMTFMLRVKSLVSKVMWYVRAVIDILLVRPHRKALEEMSAMEVILQRAKERQCPLYVSRPLSPRLLQEYNFSLGIAGQAQLQNAGLAVQLVNKLEQSRHKLTTDLEDDGIVKESITTAYASVENIPTLETTKLDPSTIQGLSSCFWPGRAQMVSRDHITYFLDGAHTPDSLKVCAAWFRESARKELITIGLSRSEVSRVLMFNIAGERTAGHLLPHIKDCDFDVAVFCPNQSSTLDSGRNAEHIPDRCEPLEEKMKVTEGCRQAWLKLCGETALSHSFTCVEEALTWATQDKDPLVKVRDPSAILPELPAHLCHAKHIQVLITGNFRLVGNSMGLLRLNQDW